MWFRFTDDLMTSQIKIRLGEYDFTLNSKDNPHIERGVIKKVRFCRTLKLEDSISNVVSWVFIK